MSAQNQKQPCKFEDAARLIALTESDAAWLAYGLRFWIWPQERWSAVMRKKYGPGLGMFADFARMRRGRAEVVKALKVTIPEAVETLMNLTGDFSLREFIIDPALGPGFGALDHVRLVQLLHALRTRSMEASRSPELTGPNGKARAGRNKALPPGQVDEKVACAATVMVAWKMVRGDLPGPQMQEAAAAAEILFALGLAPAGRYDQVKPRRGWGDVPTKAWGPHFKTAAIPSPALDRMNTMFTGELEFIRRWHAGDPAARAFPTMLAVNPLDNETI